MYVVQSAQETEKLMEQALNDVSHLLVTLQAKEYSSENLESIFKVNTYVFMYACTHVCVCVCMYACTHVCVCVCVLCVAFGALDPVE